MKDEKESEKNDSNINRSQTNNDNVSKKSKFKIILKIKKNHELLNPHNKKKK